MRLAVLMAAMNQIQHVDVEQNPSLPNPLPRKAEGPYVIATAAQLAMSDALLSVKLCHIFGGNCGIIAGKVLPLHRNFTQTRG